MCIYIYDDQQFSTNPTLAASNPKLVCDATTRGGAWKASRGLKINSFVEWRFFFSFDKLCWVSGH